MNSRGAGMMTSSVSAQQPALSSMNTGHMTSATATGGGHMPSAAATGGGHMMGSQQQMLQQQQQNRQNLLQQQQQAMRSAAGVNNPTVASSAPGIQPQQQMPTSLQQGMLSSLQGARYNKIQTKVVIAGVNSAPILSYCLCCP